MTQEPGSTNEDTAMLTAEGLSVAYDDIPAVSDVTLAFARGEVTALIGPAGSGKTSVLRALNRLHDLTPTARVHGSVRLHGKDVYDTDVDAFEVRRRVGMVFETPAPFPMSIYDNVAWGARMHARTLDLDAVVEQGLERAGLWDEVKDKLRQSALRLSAGQQQRLCIARTIAVDPDVILMDEVTAPLDPISTGKVEELILTLRQDYAIVLATHNVQQAGRLSDRVAFFLVDDNRTGRLIEWAETDSMFFAPRDARTEAYISGRAGSDLSTRGRTG